MGVIEEILRLKDEASSTLRKVADEAEGASEEVQEVSRASVSASLSLAKFGAAGAAAALGLQQMVAQVVATRREVEFLAGSTGASTQSVAGLRQAFRLAGRDASEAEGALKGLQQQLRAAAEGTESAAAAFGSLGLSGEQLASGNFDDALAKVIERLQAIEDDGLRARTAMAVLGEEGSKLIAVLGDERFESFVTLTQRYGDQYGPDAVAVTREWSDAWGRLTLSIEGAAGALTDKILPAATGAIRQLLTFSSTLGFLVDDVVDLGSGAFGLGTTTGRAPGTSLADGSALDRARESVARLFGERSGKAGGAGKGTGGGASFLDLLQPNFLDLAVAGLSSGAGAGSAIVGGGASGKSTAALTAAELDALSKQAATAFAELVEATRKQARDLKEVAVAELAAREEAALAAKQAAILEAEVKGNLERLVVESRRAQLQAVAGGINAASGLLTNAAGTLPGLLSSAGPAGAIAGASIGLLGSIGQGGAGAVDKQLDFFVEGIVRGLEALPEILIEVLPQFVQAIVTELPPAIARALYEIIAGPLRGFEGRARGAASQGSGISLIDLAQAASGQTPSSTRSRGATGQTINLNQFGYVTPRAQDEMVNDLNRLLGPRGRNFSLRGA